MSYLICSMLEMIMLMLVNLLSTFNPTDIWNPPQNLSPQKMRSSTRFLENILFLGPYKFSEYDDFIFVCTMANNTHQISLKAGNCSSTLCNTIIGSLVEGKWILLLSFIYAYHSWRWSHEKEENAKQKTTVH